MAGGSVCRSFWYGESRLLDLGSPSRIRDPLVEEPSAYIIIRRRVESAKPMRSKSDRQDRALNVTHTFRASVLGNRGRYFPWAVRRLHRSWHSGVPAQAARGVREGVRVPEAGRIGRPSLAGDTGPAWAIAIEVGSSTAGTSSSRAARRSEQQRQRQQEPFDGSTSEPTSSRQATDK